jgi:superfamily II DNA or RNA helicase
MQLRPYQTAILDAILTNYRQGIRRQAVVAATGTGKTLCFAQIPSLMHADLPGQILVLVHTEELVEQNAEELRKSNPDLNVDIEMAERHADPNANIIVASVPTLGRARTSRREKFNWDNITICICDELHHSVSETYRRIFETGGFLKAGTHKLLVGFTATQNRSDGTPLNEIYEKIVYDYPIRRGIEEKFLCDLTGVRVDTRTCLDYVHTVSGEFNQTELAETVNTPERNSLIVESWIKEARPRKSVAFTVNIEHAQDLAKAFRQHGIAAEASWGTDPERAAKLARHKSGETLVLTNCAILLEGYNDPSIACIILARPTKSSLLFTQAIGRGTRLFEGKANCLIIDVVDSTKRHSLASLASLLGLPKTLNLRGQSAIAALKIVEDAAREYPHVDLSGLRDIAKLQEYIEQVNFWDTKFPEEVEQFSEFVWHRSLGGFVLSMPNREKLEIKQNLLGTFDITGVLNGRSIGFVADSLEQAFHKCDALVVAKVSQHLPVLTRKAKWHDAPATPAQILTLSKLLRGTGRVIPENLSKGEASRVIGQQIAAFKPRPARPAWLEAKINSRKGKVA